MADIEESLMRLISKKGVQYELETLSSPNLPKNIKEDLSKKYYLIDGYPNVSLISSLIWQTPYISIAYVDIPISSLSCDWELFYFVCNFYKYFNNYGILLF